MGKPLIRFSFMPLEKLSWAPFLYVTSASWQAEPVTNLLVALAVAAVTGFISARHAVFMPYEAPSPYFRGFYQLKSLALPREAAKLSNVNYIAISLGKSSFIDLQTVSESAPKPSPEQNRRTARDYSADRSLTMTRERELLGCLKECGRSFAPSTSFGAGSDGL